MSSSQEIATRTPLNEIVEQIRSADFAEQVRSALPGNVTPARFVRVTVTALRENPDVANADRASLFSSVVRCAQDGLLPDSREAALVVFGNKVVYMPMIGGFRKIAAEFGWSLRTRVVYENDTFEHTLGLDETLVHNPARPGLERGPLVAAYAIATHRDGRREIEVVYAEDIAKIRAASRSANRGPWVDWPDRMWEKSAGRRLFAKLPLGERDRARIASVLDADSALPPAVQLYGPEAISQPETQPSSPEENGDRQGAEGAVDEAERATTPSETDGTSAPADAAEPVEEGQFAVPEGVATDSPEIMAANEAAEIAFESGKYKGRSLREVAGDGTEGTDYLRWVLANWKTPTFRSKVLAYCAVYEPQLAEGAEKEAGS